MECLGDDEVLGLASGRLPVEPAIEAHLAACPTCCVAVAEMGRLFEERGRAGHTGPTLVAQPRGSGAAPSRERDLPAGTLVGRYAIERPLGRGGMGIVYAANDPGLARRIALKLLRTDVKGVAADQERLLREARAMAQLSHPNVVAAFDVGVFEDQVFVAMELVEGRTLREWIRAEPPRPWRDMLAALLEAGKGLAAAHAAGIVHRDFKPENVLIGDDGRVRVTDFGIARAADDNETHTLYPRPVTPHSLPALTEAGVRAGTPSYMAPEQLTAGSVVDPRADQFGFCVTAYEALWGKRPFPAESTAVFARAVYARELAGRDGREVPGGVLDVIARGLSYEPEQRYGSMNELLAALEVAARPPRRRTARWLAAAAVVVASASGMVAWRVVGSDDARSANKVAPAFVPATPSAQAGTEPAPTTPPPTEQVAAPPPAPHPEPPPAPRAAPPPAPHVAPSRAATTQHDRHVPTKPAPKPAPKPAGTQLGDHLADPFSR